MVQQFIRHIVNGLFATAVHFGVLSFNLLVVGMESAGLANMIAAVIGAATSFLGSRYYVFRAANCSPVRQALSFATLYAVIAILHGVILYVWTDVNGLDYRFGFVIATGVQVFISYLGNMAWVFRTNKGRQAQ